MARTRLVFIVNRTTSPIDCMFDGAPEVIPPGYKKTLVPKLDKNGRQILLKGGDKDGDVELVEKVIGAGPNGEPYAQQVEYAAAEAYIRQHPIMGTSNPKSVDARDTEYLLGVQAWGHEIDPREQSDALELIDRSQLPEDRQNIELRHLAGRQSVSPGAITDRKIQANKRRAALDAGDNPTGMRLTHQ